MLSVWIACGMVLRRGDQLRGEALALSRAQAVEEKQEGGSRCQVNLK